MSEETLDPKPNVGGPTPRTKAGTVDKPTPKVKVSDEVAPKPDFSKGLGNQVSEPTPKKPAGLGFTVKPEKPKVSFANPPSTTPDRPLTAKEGAEITRIASEVEARDQELKSLVGKELDIQNLFTAVKKGDEVVVGNQTLKTPEELEAFLSEPSQLSTFYNENRQDLAKFFRIGSEKDFTGKVTGGLSDLEKTQYTDQTLATIYDPVFRKKSVKVGDPGYRAEYDQFAPDPIAEQYQIAQRTFQANQQFSKLQQNNLAVDAYGQKIEKPEDFYEYLRDPMNRDAYQRKYGKQLKEIGVGNVNDVLKPVILESASLGAVYSRTITDSKMRVAKGTDIVKRDVLGKSAVVFDEKETSSSISNISEADLGKLLYEYELGNNINLDIPNASGRGYTSITRDNLVSKLEANGIEEGEIDQILEGYRSQYEQNLATTAYEENRAKLGYTIGKDGVRYSKYDQVKEQRALSELSKEEQKIASLYDQVRDIYATGKRVKGRKDIILTPEQQSKVATLRAQIEQLKRESGFFSFNAIPQQEFFDPEGNRLEGKDKEKTQSVFASTMDAEKKTDLAILKEKRNVLYEQLDALNEKYKKIATKGGGGLDLSGLRVVLPENYDRDKLDADFEEARSKDAPYLAKLAGGMLGGGDIMYTDQMKANFIYRRNIKDKILEKQAQIKAVNKIIYTNADLTKLETSGVFYNMFTDASKTVAETFTGGSYLTPTEEITEAVNFLQSNGMYVNPEIADSLKGINEDRAMGQGMLGSLGIGLQLGLYGRGVKTNMAKAFTGKSAVAARAYMSSRYGKTGNAAFTLFENAAVNYGVSFASYEAAGLDGSSGVAEELGQQSFDKLTGVLKLGRFVPNNIVGKMLVLLGRTVSGAAGSFTEETFANVWGEMKANGFDIRLAVENAYGKTDDERLFNLRSLAFSSIVFSTANVGNLGILFKTRTEFQAYLNQNYGENISEVDRELLDLLDQTIKNGSNDDDAADLIPEVSLATATVSAVDGRPNTTEVPFDQPMTMSSGPVEPDQRTTNASAASSGAGTEGVKVEKRTGNMGEEFYVSTKNGVVDNKVVYRYNSETGQLEAKGLTSTTEEFVPLNEKTREYVESQSKEHGIVSKEQVENIAIKNVEARRAQANKNSSEAPMDDRVAYQAPTQTSRRKKERISKVEQSAKARYNPKFEADAQARTGLFTGIAEEVKVEDDAVKETASEMSRGFGTKMKINLTSFFKDGKAVVTDLARKKAAKVGDYMAPLFKDFDNTFFDQTDFDLETETPVRERQSDAITDKVREAVSRNTFFNEVFGRMVSEGRMSKEDAVDNFIVNLLQNSNEKVKEIFGNDKAGVDAFKDLRKQFNNFVAVKYTGANTFSTTNAFVRNTPMSTNTTKNRRADMKKEAAELAQENQKRNQTAQILSNTTEEGAFVTGDQVDAARFLDGDIGADEFLQNTNTTIPANATVDQKTQLASTTARGLIDYQKYTDAKLLTAQNNLTRDKYRKELEKDVSDSFDLKTTIKTPFQFRKRLRQKRAVADVYLRTLEGAATRAGMTLENFMQTRFGILKRTEQQFQEWLKMSPSLVPYYQGGATVEPETAYLSLNKAVELKTKGFSLEKIQFLTGVVLDESSNLVGFEKPVKFAPVKKDAKGKYTNTLLRKLVDKFEYFVADPSTVLLNTEDLLSTYDNPELFTNYPDLTLLNVVAVNDPNLPPVSFKPNNIYTGTGKSKQSPGTIIINSSSFNEKYLDNNDFEIPFKSVFTPALENSIKQSMLFMEGEFTESPISKFITPTAIRSKLSEFKTSQVIDDNTVELINSVLDFYSDKNVFSYSAYTSLFVDVASGIYNVRTDETLIPHLERVATAYDLSEADVLELKSIYDKFRSTYGEGDKSSYKKMHNAYVVLSNLTGLDNDELIAKEVVPASELNRVIATSLFAKAKSPEQVKNEIEELYFTKLSREISTINKTILEAYKNFNPDDVPYEIEVAYEKVKKLEDLKAIVKESISDIDTDAQVTAMQQLLEFFNAESYREEVVDVAMSIYDLEKFSTQSGYVEAVPRTHLIELEDKKLIPNSKYEVYKVVEDIVKFVEGSAKPVIQSTTNYNDIYNGESKEYFYSLFPGIDQYMNGIYDPFKPIGNFTETELKESLVDSNLVSQEKFDKIYGQYKNNPSDFKGSVASIFLDALQSPSKEDNKAISEKLQRRQLIEKNIGTAFYSNAEYAIAKLVTEQDKIQLSDLKPLLVKNGAKQNELNWVGLDEFIESKAGQKFVTAGELLEWSSSFPSYISYDQSSPLQIRNAIEVVELSSNGSMRFKTIETLGKDKFKDDTSAFTTDFPQYIVPPKTTSPNMVFAVKYDDGTHGLVDLQSIISDPNFMDSYFFYIDGSTDDETFENYEKLKEVVDQIQKFGQFPTFTPEQQKQVKELVKAFAQAKSNLQTYRSNIVYDSNKVQVDGEIENSYRVHMISVPLSQNKVFKDFNNQILSLAKEMDAIDQKLGTLSEKSEQAKTLKRKFTELHKQFEQVKKQKDAMTVVFGFGPNTPENYNLFNYRHFYEIPHEVLFHLRTSLIIDKDGEKALFVHEIQSDKSQDLSSAMRSLKDKINRKDEIGLSEQTVAEYQARLDELKNYTKKAVPFLEREAYTDAAIKQALKIASDQNVKKIVFANGSTIGPAVGAMGPSMRAGVSKFYNFDIPNRLKKLSGQMNFEVGVSNLDFPTLADLGLPKDALITLDVNAYPTYVNSKGETVDNEGEQLPASEFDSSFLANISRTDTTGNIDVRKPAPTKDDPNATEPVAYLQFPSFNSITLSDETLNKVSDGMVLFQQGQAGPHGATVTTDQGKHIIFALTNPNVSTAVHELAHIWERYMTATEKQQFMDQVGHPTWDMRTSEAFARGFEKYLYDGKAPSGAMQSMFDNFKKWILKVYGGIIGTPIEMEISEPMRKLYDTMLGEAKVDPIVQRKSSDVFDDIGKFIEEIKNNPQFDGVTDDELYTALMRSGFEPDDVQDYFSLKQRANIAKQQQRKGPFQQEADLMQDEAEAMRVVRDQKALVDEIENMDPTEYPVILQTLFDIMEDGDVPLAKAIMDLVKAKQTGGDPEMIAKQYSAILKAGTSVGRMLQLFRQLTKDTYVSSAEGMFRRNEKKGLNIPEQAKEKIRKAAQELDQLKDQYKQSRDIASSDPYGTSKLDPSKTNLQYNIDLYDKLQEAVKRFVDARMPFEGDDSITDMYRSFVKGGLMTPGSMSVNTLSNISKFFTGLLVDPIKSAISLGMFKTGITSQQYTKTSLKDWWSGVKYGMPSGLSRAYKILKDGSMTQGYQTPDAYVQGFSFYKSFAKFFGLKLDQLRRAAGQINLTDEELADKHGFKTNMQGQIPTKQQAIAGLQATFGIVPDIVFRVMGATDAVFRDFSYYAAVSEQFKFTKEHDRYIAAIKNTKDSKEKDKLRKEYDAVRKAYIQINSDFQNTPANEEAMRYVYTNDNATTDLVTKVQGITRTDINQNSVYAKVARLAGTAVIPFTRIPSNYAVELMEFFIPEYALAKIATNGFKAFNRSRKIAAGEEIDQTETLTQRGKDARSLDRILARALVGTGIQFLALEMVKAGAISGAPDDENEEDKQKSMTYSYSLERPYSINLTLVKDAFMQMMNPDYKSNRKSKLWDKENDLIIDYRAMGVFGAALYIQFKENKLALEQSNKYVNRGEFAKITEDFALNMFGNINSAGSYIIDQTFVRGIMSVAKAISDENENMSAAFLADMVLTLSAGMVPNSLAWIDKMNREFVVDYDAKEAPAFKAFGMRIEDPQATLFWTKLATKMAERWPIGDPASYVDLPFVETEMDLLPVKVDAFGKPIQQTPEGASMGTFLYNTFDVFKASRVLAGYDTPDWEALVYLAVKKGDVWNALPSMLPRNVKTPSGMYKFAPNEYNNLLQYNSLIKRDLVNDALIKNGTFKDLIDPNSRINKDPRTGKPITGEKNINVLMGYEQLGKILSELYAAADQITDLYTYSFIDKERKKLLEEDPDRFYALVRKEMLSPMGAMQQNLYGGQESGSTNMARTNSDLNAFDITRDFITNPEVFKRYSTGAMQLFKDFNADPKTLIISAQNQNTDVKGSTTPTVNGMEEIPLDEQVPATPPTPKKTPVVEAVKQQRKQVEQAGPRTVNGLEEIPFD
jgi:hypothetical protein